MAYFIITLSLLSLCFYSYKFTKTGNVLLLLPLFYNFVVLYVICGVFLFTYAKDTPFDLYSLISNEDIYKASIMFMVSSFLFYLGGTFVKEKQLIHRDYLVANLNIKYQKTLLFGVFFIFILYIIGYGFESLISRRGYIDQSNERNKTIMIIFFVCSPFLMALIPFIKTKIVKYLVFLMCFLILLSSSSRFIVMLPFLYIVGTFLRFKKIPMKVIFVNVFLILTGLVFVLQIRYYTYHGLIPNITALFTSGLDVNYLFIGLNYAFSFSLFGVAYILKNFTNDNLLVLISINPLPSRFIDINYMLEAQRMLGTSPMSGLSALSLAGYLILTSFYFITGFCFSFILNKMKGKTFLYFAIVGLFIMFTLFSIQYNLRGLSRFFYYSILIFIFYMLITKFKIRKRPRA